VSSDPGSFSRYSPGPTIAEQARCLGRQGHLVGAAVAAREPDAEGLHLPRVLGHHGGDRGGVDPAAQHHPHGSVAHHLAHHGTLESREVLVDQLVRVAAVRAGLAGPVAALGHPVRARGQRGGGRQLAHAGEQRLRRRHEAKGEVVVDRREVEVARQRVVHQQRLQLGREREAPAVPGPVQGLDPELVAHQVQLAAAPVPERDPEDAVELLHEREAELLVEMRDHLAVAVGAQLVTALLEPAAQLELVVDLAVEHHGDLPGLVEERLVPVLGIHDRQAAHAERDTVLVAVALAVGAAVRELCGHRAHELRIRAAARRVLAGYPAHDGLRPALDTLPPAHDGLR
jgi:hypothetical protein